MNTTNKPTAVAYFRTSSQTNVGADKDSLKRQQDAVRACAAARGIEIVHEYYDAAVSGADAVDARPGFSDMLAYMLGNGARIIIVENASRFARDLIVQETGYQMLKARGIELVAADAPDSFLSDTPTAALIRQILGAVAQFDKTTLVNKLRGARDRRRRDTGRCEGRTDWKSAPTAAVDAAKAAYAGGLSLREVSAELQAKGFLNQNGKPYAAQSVALMVDREHCAKQRAVRRSARARLP
jgi:DNA invertase Pin-like site-specific DNA recombinase